MGRKGSSVTGVTRNDPEYSKLYYLVHRDRIRKNVQKWRKDNAVKVLATDRNKHYQRKFGITLEEFEKLEKDQKGLCALCEQKCAAHKHLAVDHNHETGAVRGLLCLRCNTGIAQFEKYNLFDKAKEYVSNTLHPRPTNPLSAPKCPYFSKAS